MSYLKWVSFFVLGVLGAVACGGGSDTTVQIGGRFVGAGGQALRSDAFVTVVPGPNHNDFGLSAVFGSPGLICGASTAPSGCGDAGERTALGAGGSYTFSLSGDQAERALGPFGTLVVATGMPAAGGELDGPTTSISVRAQAESLEVGQVALWAPTINVTADSAIAFFDWPALPPGYGNPDGYDVVFDAGPTAGVWSVFAPTAPVGVDARVLEDFRGGVSVVGRSTTPVNGRAAQVRYRSARQPFAGTLGAPRSRGVGCGAVEGGGRVSSLSACSLTDGDLGQRLGGNPQAAAVDLGESAEVTLVVVRGCRSRCDVTTSEDGATWLALGTTLGTLSSVGSAEPRVARYIKVTASTQEATPPLPAPAPAAPGADVEAAPSPVAPEPPDVGGLTEISVWTGALPATSQPSVVIGAAQVDALEQAAPPQVASGGSGGGGNSSGSGAKIGLGIFALILILGVGAGGVFARRSQG